MHLRSHASIRKILWLRILSILMVTEAFADEDLDFFPGLIGTYESGSTSVERIDRTLSFDWGGEAPDERLRAESFDAEWNGNLLVRLPGRHQFHVFVAGDASIAIDEKTVLEASHQWGFVSGEAVDLGGGDHEIKVSYSTPEESDKPRARLSVFWSSDAFTLEPLPADVLSREEPSPAVSHAEHGRLLTDAHRCAACHRSESSLPVLAAPALDRVIGSQDVGTLVERIWRPQNVVANSHMPSFDFSPSEAESVAAYLTSVSKKAPSESKVKFKDGDQQTGNKLLISLGCVACHEVPGGLKKQKTLASPYDAPELTHVHRRRSVPWLDRWLKDPRSLNVDHRMPVFDLSSEERRQLVAALSTKPDTAEERPEFRRMPPESQEEAIAAGRKIIKESNCAACHRIPGIESKSFEPLTANSFGNPRGDCLNPADIPNLRSEPGKRVPSFHGFMKKHNEQRAAGATKTDSEKVAAWFASFPGKPSKLSQPEYGRLLLARNGCTACHDRNQERGLSSVASKLQKLHKDLNGQSQGLVPPALTAVGDKLNDDYLKTAVAGEQKERRLPWLHVRMPKFNHSKLDHAAILRHLVTADRIPDEADAARQDVLAHVDLSGNSKTTTEELLTGNQLAGAAGFNCVACHKAGEFEPRNVALGTRGSDIMTMGSRIRPRFFQRWMKNPIRVVAGIEMPAIKRGVPGILDDSLPAQIGLLWKAFSDERFTPPTVTSRFEQVVNAEPGGRPKIIRDVFTIGTGKQRESVARAMAIGFGNGHNILIDLDTMQIRLWSVGEFARQRTEGKSWFWDMSGVVVRGSDAYDNPVQELSPKSKTLMYDEGRLSRLLSYQVLENAVELTVRWQAYNADETKAKLLDTRGTEPHFEKPLEELLRSVSQEIVTVHRFSERSEGAQQDGWSHTMTVVKAPRDVHLESDLVGRLSQGWSSGPGKSMNVKVSPEPKVAIAAGETKTVSLTTSASLPVTTLPPPKPVVAATSQTITSTPGFTGNRLPIDMSVMPTAMAWLPDGRMVFTSLKGHVWVAADTNEDGLPDKTELFEEGLAAPFGVLADDDGSIVVAHKPELLRLRDTDGDGRADERTVVASGWGFNDNYHDWTSGLIRDDRGNMYVGLGSDYSQKKRPETQDRWRGGVIRIAPDGKITPLGMSMRYPMGLAMDRDGNLFATDNQGVQNTFNEINHIIEGMHYGVPSRHQPTDGLEHETPALMVPHPWTRSVNSILFLPDDFPVESLRGHGIGCEYDSRFLIRFTVQNVNGTLQGASYRFSLPDQEAGDSNFIGPICSAVSPAGEIYIGSIWDSGWQGGPNTGGISRLVPSAEGLPNGIREVTAIAGGFEIEFFEPVAAEAAADASSWSIQAYTRKWGGSYATPDSGRHTLQPSKIEVLQSGRRVRIHLDDLRSGFLYDIVTAGPLAKSQDLWPSEAHYSMKVVPR